MMSEKELHELTVLINNENLDIIDTRKNDIHRKTSHMQEERFSKLDMT